MSAITTAGVWIPLPTAGGADDRARADEPGGAGLFQVLGSNATLAARENELRTLWERGPADVWADLPTPGDERSFNWSGELGDGALAHFAGLHRLRNYGETNELPRVRLTARVAAPTDEEVGLVVLAMPAHGTPSMAEGLYAFATSTDTSVKTVHATLTLPPEHRSQFTVASGAPSAFETGQHPAVALYVGAWCTSDDSFVKANFAGLSLYLLEPA